ncbi:hypothetical protein SPRG_07216 [Saprolegnia parasitica CBS 223.65]|uniref:FYVE-type domain-containing protein n=1 Tax=Saprolegnia parasitica (strain CBS 223.65) TaxID=695850 RepID=A0A067CFH9_SAPPC|nr:hypothetical protein SPRG_07216 [Saprolegnia parasitica CBS 223.65]KDO27940.1 hypothetical protein SPRG_07216 [Saprolegnia parasitica CBS 223.65]|eukprot:XP_012201395.1 hypothetical protein SPRG_07216 [Saprolegnia parasitica CBS 223.65]
MDPTVRSSLVSTARETSATFVAFCTSPKITSALTYLGDDRRIQLYDGRVRGRYVAKAVTLMPGTVHDVLAALAVDSTPALAKTMRMLFGKAFADGMTLHASSKPAEESDGVHVHWLALLGGQNMGDMAECDAVLASHTQYYEPDATDAMELLATPTFSPAVIAGSHVWESTTLLRSLEPVPSRHPTPRLDLRSSGVYVEAAVSDRGLNEHVVRVTMVLSLAGLVSGATTELSRVARRGTIQLVPREEWAHSRACAQCAVTFRLFRRRHHCRLCGHAVCGTCSCAMDLDYPMLANGDVVRHATVRSCTRCAFESHTLVHRGTARSHSAPLDMAVSDPTPSSRRRVWSITTAPLSSSASSSRLQRGSSSYFDFSDSECGTPLHAGTPSRRPCQPIAEMGGDSSVGYKPLDRAERMRRRASPPNIKPRIKLIEDDLLEELLMTASQSNDEDDGGLRLSQIDLSVSPLAPDDAFPSLSSRGAVARQLEKHLSEDPILIDYGDALSSKRYSAKSEDMICLHTTTV